MSNFINFRNLGTPKTPTCQRMPRKRKRSSTVSVVWKSNHPCHVPCRGVMSGAFRIAINQKEYE